MNSNQQQPQEPTTSSSQSTSQLPPVDFGNQLKLTLLDEHHQVDVHNTSDNFWKEQSDEEFLKTLFENTLLSDHDFSKKATDFSDLGLGFDNLQLNYDATGVNEDDQTTHHTSLSTLLSNINTATGTNSTNTSHAPPGSNDDHVITSLNDALSTSKLAAVENDHNANNHAVLTTIMTNENPLLAPSNHPPPDDQQQRQNPPNTSSASASADSPSFVIIENLITTSDLLIKNVDCNNRENDDDDDKIFKRPSNDFLKFSLPGETTATATTSTTDNYTGDMSVKQMKMLRLKKAEELCKRDELKAAKLKENNKLTGKQQQHHELKSNQLGSKIKRSRKRTKLISGSVSSVTSSATNPANHEATAANAHSSERKILKQSMFDSSTAGNRQHILASKKDKLNAKVNNNNNNNKNNLTPTNIEPLSKKFAPSSVAFGDLKSLLTNNNNWFKFDSIDLNDAKKMLNSESLIKPTTSNSPHVATKKDEVDLHIRELSLLDLHSSEDDSSFDPNKRNGINRMFSSGQIKLIPSKSSTNTNTNANNNANTNEKASIFNEIISKRIKYSTPAPTSSLTDSSSSQPCTSSLSLSTTASHISTGSSTQLLPTSAALSTATDEETNKLDDFIEYLSKSLDSTATATATASSTNAVSISDNNNSQASSSNTNTISSTRFNAKKQSNSCISTSDLIVSPPSPSNISKSQIKRKKKDNQNNNYPLVLISVESSAAPAAGGSNECPATNLERKNAPDTNTHSSITPGESEFSRSIENDTLQHMKNLDINNDLNAPKLNTLLSDLASGRKHEKMARQVAQDQADSNIFSNPGSTNILGGNSNKIELPNKLNLNLNDVNSRNYLWNLLKSHTPVDELIHHFGASLHDKISFWDLVQLKLKFSQNNHLKTTYEIIDDYTVLYSNMSALLERYVNEQSSLNSRSMSSKKSTENSSRSRSSSRNFRKQSTSK